MNVTVVRGDYGTDFQCVSVGLVDIMAYKRGTNGAYSQTSDHDRTDTPFLAYIGPAANFSACFVSAIETEFPGTTVLQFGDFTELVSARRNLKSPIQLILIDESLIRQLEVHVSSLAEAFGDKIIAIASNDHQPSEEARAAYFNVPEIRGFLPMNIKLDIWLSIIGLMMRGGEYAPPNIIAGYPFHGPYGYKAASRKNPGERGAPEPAACSTESLTPREVEVLALVSMGHQNKIIAAMLSLSEHTVKLHMHNIITKLGAHNRTEAAAIYRNRERVEAAHVY